MGDQSIIPQSNWQAIPQNRDKNFVGGDTNCSFLAIADSYYPANIQPKLLVPAGEDRMVISCDFYHMYCIDTVTGEIIWKIKEQGGYGANDHFKHTCYYNGVLYTGITDTFFTAINPENGEYLWKVNCGKTKTSFSSPFLFHDNKVFLNSGDTAFCINLSTHKIEWKTKIAKKESIYRRMPFVWKNYLVYHSANTDKHFYHEMYADKYKLYFFNIETGEIETTKDMINAPKTWNFPLHVTKDTLWYASNNNSLYSYDLEKGKELKLELGNYLTWGNCFILNEDKIYDTLSIDKKCGLFYYDTTNQDLKKIVDEKDFNVHVDHITWVKADDYLYGYCKSAKDGGSEYVYRLSLIDHSFKKLKGIPKTENEWFNKMFNGIEGFNVVNGVCYLSSRFKLEGGTDEDARICLWAFW